MLRVYKYICVDTHVYIYIYIYGNPPPTIQLEYVSYAKTLVLCIFSMVEFWAISFFYSCKHYLFKDRHIRNMSQIYMELQ